MKFLTPSCEALLTTLKAKLPFNEEGQKKTKTTEVTKAPPTEQNGKNQGLMF